MELSDSKKEKEIQLPPDFLLDLRLLLLLGLLLLLLLGLLRRRLLLLGTDGLGGGAGELDFEPKPIPNPPILSILDHR